MFRNILCAVDGSRTSTAAVRMATTLAGPDGHLTLLAVTAVSGSGPWSTAAIGPSRVKDVLNRATRIADAAGVRSTTTVDKRRPPVDVILELAGEHDLLAIGAPPTSLLGGIMLGGVAVTALGRFTTPLLVARGSTGALRGGRILAASDGSADSNRIVELAGQLGLSLGTGVTLLHAVGRESQVSHRRINAQARALDALLPKATDVFIDASDVADVIISAATRNNAALIVMGSRRLRGPRVFSSVSRHVVHDARCSVLLLPPR